MKYRVEVNTYGDKPDAWTGNAVTYDTAEEARKYAVDLYQRWTAVKYWRVIDQNEVVHSTNQEISA